MICITLSLLPTVVAGEVQHPDGVRVAAGHAAGGVQRGPADHRGVPRPGAARRHPC